MQCKLWLIKLSFVQMKLIFGTDIITVNLIRYQKVSYKLRQHELQLFGQDHYHPLECPTHPRGDIPDIYNHHGLMVFHSDIIGFWITHNILIPIVVYLYRKCVDHFGYYKKSNKKTPFRPRVYVQSEYIDRHLFCGRSKM